MTKLLTFVSGAAAAGGFPLDPPPYRKRAKSP
jgi:hypothetical protein